MTLIVSNSKEDSEEDVVVVTAATPVAKAGQNIKIPTGSTMDLSGRNSRDPNDYSLSYYWTIKAKPMDSLASLNDNTIINPSFISDKDGAYEFSLVVNNGFVNSVEDVVTFTSTTAPIANAGIDQSVSKNEIVILDGSDSSDSKGAGLIYQWTLLSKPDGSSAVLSERLASNPIFNADVEGEYVIALVVNNGTDNSDEDAVTVLATLPIADAGPDYNAALGDVYILDARKSQDPNGYPFSYSWEIISSPLNSTAVISDPTIVTPSITIDEEGTYTISLVTNNEYAVSIEDIVTINGRVSVGNNSGVFSTDFENSSENSRWSVSNGMWEIGSPTYGVNVAYVGFNVAATVLNGNYPSSGASLFSSPSITLPTILSGQTINLGFWHWFNFASPPTDTGTVLVRVETSPGNWEAWVSLSTISNFSGSWSYKSVELTSYANQNIQVGFQLTNSTAYCYPSHCSRILAGWYIDELIIEKITP